MVTNYNIFLNENLSKKLELDVNSHLFNTGYKIFFDIYVGGKEIGRCEIETFFKTDEFDPISCDYSLSQNMEFDYNNPVRKDYYNNLNFIIGISNFEIDEEYRGNNYGFESMKLIVSYLQKRFPKNKGIYLTVFDINTPALKIYEKLGFKKVCEKKWSEKAYIMKL